MITINLEDVLGQIKIGRLYKPLDTGNGYVVCDLFKVVVNDFGYFETFKKNATIDNGVIKFDWKPCEPEWFTRFYFYINRHTHNLFFYTISDYLFKDVLLPLLRSYKDDVLVKFANNECVISAISLASSRYYLPELVKILNVYIWKNTSFKNKNPITYAIAKKNNELARKQVKQIAILKGDYSSLTRNGADSTLFNLSIVDYNHCALKFKNTTDKELDDILKSVEHKKGLYVADILNFRKKPSVIANNPPILLRNRKHHALLNRRFKRLSISRSDYYLLFDLPKTISLRMIDDIYDFLRTKEEPQLVLDQYKVSHFLSENTKRRIVSLKGIAEITYVLGRNIKEYVLYNNPEYVDLLKNQIAKVNKAWIAYVHDKDVTLIKEKASKEVRKRTRTRLVNRLTHVYDIVFNRKIVIRKNQNFESIYNMCLRIDGELRDIENKIDIEEAKKNYWEPVLSETMLEAFKRNYPQYQVKELVTEYELLREGEKLMHCVRAYSDYCKKNSYRVFSISDKLESATLGINIKHNSCVIDQVRGYDNDPVSDEMYEYAKALVSFIRENMRLNQLVA